MKTEENPRSSRINLGATVPSEYLAGLKKDPKRLPSKFFYDDRGSRLFDRICNLEEYYLTRSEFSILREKAESIAAIAGKRVALVDLGSGTGEKGRILLNQLSEPVAYIPVEISREQLNRSVEETRNAFPKIPIAPLCVDYTRDLTLPDVADRAERILVFFPGSTIGNFEPTEAVDFFQKVADLDRKGVSLLIGVDLKKEKAILDAAYNDAAGVTAAFNLNILARANREWGTDFLLDQFSHRAFYDPLEGRVVMQLESRSEQEVRVGRELIGFDRHERITTEHSYKYTVEEFLALARRGRFSPEAVWTDRDRLFSLHYMTAA